MNLRTMLACILTIGLALACAIEAEQPKGETKTTIETTGTETPQGETYRADRLRAWEAATTFMGYMVGKSKPTDPEDFIAFLMEQYAEIRAECQKKGAK